MRLRHAKTLITGKPGVGKTTLIRKIVEQIQPVSLAGFYTSEIKSRGHRSGFELRGLKGDRRILAHVALESRHRVGKYGVDTPGFEVFLDGLPFNDSRRRLYVIDEIGKMELYSRRFRRLVDELLKGPQALLATVALKGKSYTQEVKRRKDVILYEVNADNRNVLTAEIVKKIKGL